MANNTKSQNRSGSNQNKQGYNKKSAAAPTQEAQNTPVVKNEEKQVYKAKQTLTPDMYITVKNGFNGTLVYKSKKTGERFIWEAFGDEQDIELAELKAAKNSYKAFFVNNWFLFDDPEVVEWLGMSQYYKHALNSESFDKLFEKTPEEIEKTISELSAGQKKSVVFRAKQLIDEGVIDSMKVIADLEKCLSVELIER